MAPFLKEGEIQPAIGSLEVIFKEDKAHEFADALQKQFPTFFMGEKTIVEAVFDAMMEKKAKLGVAESCTGGALSAKIVSLSGASLFFQGSIVAYSNAWKEKFLHVRRDTLKMDGAVSKKTVKEMIEGIFAETDVDYAVATSGMIEKEVYIAIGKKGEEIDVGKIPMPLYRQEAIELSVEIALGALWRRVAHNAWTFS